MDALDIAVIFVGLSVVVHRRYLATQRRAAARKEAEEEWELLSRLPFS